MPSKIIPFSRYIVEGNSMIPTFKKGDQLITFNWIFFLNQLKEGDVVVFRHQGLEKVKRVQKINHSKIFVVGDNENESSDSRHFGGITRDQIIGRVVYKFS